ncbi:mitochondrial ribosomal subunit protein-domain-containing protein [Aspergillus cavernicola]|uniref:Mitochondrial ribosomal subunit protein-domain-containing protein n=1 Tax=Aspergillus cavernicola TaxID=176166 RepID=A0ABR4J5E3_9EURO
MASLARSLGRSARIMMRRGPIARPYRPFSTTTPTFMPEDPPDPTPLRDPRPEDLPPAPEYSPELLSKEERLMYERMAPEEREDFDAENRRVVEDFNDIEKRKAMFAQIDKQVTQIEKDVPLRFEDGKTKGLGFWAKEEDDEFALVADNDDVFDDEITSMAHAEVELHREVREYARITAWDMPFLAKLAKPFTLPPQSHILRFRYTTYLGESHPAENKVVVELSTGDLVPQYLSEDQRQTFLKLVGTRFNPEKDIVRMSCEKYSTRAQNKRYLGDLIGTLIKEAKEGDAFTDIPLDLRHHKSKPKHRFPDSWILTEERKQQLEATRAERLRLQKERQAIVDGNSVVAEAIKVLPAFNPALRPKATDEREKVAVKAGAKGQKQRHR